MKTVTLKHPPLKGQPVVVTKDGRGKVSVEVIPMRIQRRRSTGWRKPANTVCVDRSTRYGNPYVVGKDGDAAECIRKYLQEMFPYTHRPPNNSLENLFISEAMLNFLEPLRGKNLACWCHLCDDHKDGKPLGVKCDKCAPCHADPLLTIINR